MKQIKQFVRIIYKRPLNDNKHRVFQNNTNTSAFPSSWRLFVTVSNFFALVFLIVNCYAQETSKAMVHIKENDLSVAYKKTGNGPVLVLLHGFTIDSRIWEPQINKLSEIFTVIAWDAPGAGQSSDPQEKFSLSDWADCLSGLLDSIGVEKAHILGLSWGGILAQEFYRRYPGYVLSLVLVDTYAGWKGSLSKTIVEERMTSCLQDATLPPNEFVNKYLPGMFSDSPPPEALEKLEKIMSDFHPTGFRLMAISCANTDTRDLLPSIKVPTLLIWGESDKRSPISVAHQMHAAIPGSKLEIIMGTGHVSNLEAPAQFNEIVTGFCLSLSNK